MCDAQIKLFGSLLASYDAHSLEVRSRSVEVKEPHSKANMWHIKHHLLPSLKRLLQEMKENYDELESRGAC